MLLGSSSRLCGRGVSALVAVVVLAGCSSPTEPQPPKEHREQVAAVPTTPSGEVIPVDSSPDSEGDGWAYYDSYLCPLEDAPLDHLTGAAVDEFGADAVANAYCNMGGFFMRSAVTELTDPAKASPEAAERYYTWIGRALTEPAAQRWQKMIAESSRDGGASINELTYYNIAPPQGFHYSEGRPVSINDHVSPPHADVATLPDGRTALALWFTVSNDIALHPEPGEDATHVWPLQREVALYLTPNPEPGDEHPWLVESWTTSWKALPVHKWDIS